MAERQESHVGELKAQALVWNHTLGLVDSLVLKCAVDLGIADVMKTKGYPMSLSQLAAALPAQGQSLNAACLSRMMRYLVHMGLFTAESLQGEEWYGLTSATKLILRQQEEEVGQQLKSMVPFLRLFLSPSVVDSWQALKTCLELGRGAAFETVHGDSLWGYASTHPEHNRVFNEAMASVANLVTPALISGCEELFMGIGSVVDIGGGTGTAMKLISKAFRHLKCTIFDLPHVIETLTSTADPVEGSSVGHVAGDMFSFVPPADAVLLMWILHDWEDEDCIKILERCKDAIPQEGGKVIIVDVVIDIEAEQELIHARLAFDMVMMAVTGGKERTKEEWRKLLNAAGFSHCKITPVMALQSVIEASP